MGLSTGARIGPYEVLAAIGRGGMGEVYRARDTKLGRDVALKILPETFAQDADRLARFRREAQVLASLNDPRIAAIYGIEDSDHIHALVMELVEGPTLEEVIQAAHDGPQATGDRIRAAGDGLPNTDSPLPRGLPLDDVLAIARQIADALGAAHDQGIVHRDLKPANVKVRPDGTVKVLDFGLAKATDPVGSSPGASQSPTITSPAMLTYAGVILGTAAYMSPEQAKGRPADPRSDVWAFGCVLFEMLTGRRAFEGDDVADTMALVLRGEPDWRALPAGLPPGVSLLLRRSLVRDRLERLRHAGDIRILLDELSAAPLPVPVAGGRAALGRREAVAWALAAGLIVTAGAALTTRERPSPVAMIDATRFAIQPPDAVALTGAGNQISAVISPDGRRIAFVAQRGGTQAIWIRDLGRLTVDRVAGSERAFHPFWSPDSRSLGFFADGELRVVELGSGSVRTIAEAPVGRGGAWSPEGVIVFASNVTGALSRVPAAGGPVESVTTLDASDRATSHRYPSFLPDGRRLVFSVIPTGQIRLAALDSRETSIIFAADSQAQVVRTGQIFFVRQGTLLAQPFDPVGAVTTGEPVEVERSVLSDAAGYHAFSVSDTGHVAYRSGQIVAETQLTWADRSGRVIGLVGKPDHYRNPALSPDEARLAVEMTDPVRRTQDIWLADLARNVFSRLTVDQANDGMPVWSPDGHEILFASDRGSGRLVLYRKAANSASSEELVLDLKIAGTVPYAWTPDGRSILHRLMNGVFFSTGLLPTNGDQAPRLYAARDYMLVNAEVSPDGRFVAYAANDSGQFEVFIESFPEPGSRWPVSRDGGVHPRWRPDGRELYYYAADGNLMAAPIQPDASSPAGLAVPLFRTRLVGGPTSTVGFAAQYDVTRDGRFLLNLAVAEPPPPVIHVVLNWAAAQRP